MHREEALRWLEQHPGAAHGDPERIVDACEAAVKRHAEEDAWRAAKAYVEGRMHEWEESWGFHAREGFVAREVCARLADELRRHEPRVSDEADAHLIGEALIRNLEPEARHALHEWVHDLAEAVEHRIWREIVRLTRGHGRRLVREGRVSTDESWEGTQNYAAKAAHVARMLLDEYESRLPRS